MVAGYQLCTFMSQSITISTRENKLEISKTPAEVVDLLKEGTNFRVLERSFLPQRDQCDNLFLVGDTKLLDLEHTALHRGKL